MKKTTSLIPKGCGDDPEQPSDAWPAAPSRTAPARSRVSGSSAWIRVFPVVSGIVIALAGAVVLLGWYLGNETLTSLHPEWVSMKANTALGLVLCGLALALSGRSRGPHRLLPVLMTSVVIVLTSLTLAQSFFGFNLGIDEFLFRDIDATESLSPSHPGRMAPATAFCFLLLAIGLLFLNEPVPPKIRLPLLKTFGFAVVLIGFFVLAGYFATWLLGSNWWTYTGMAAHTAGGFILLGSGLLAATFAEAGFVWSLDFWTSCGFATAIVLMLLAVNVAANFTGRMLRTTAMLAHRQEVLKEIQEVFVEISHLESIQRGYILVGNETLLAHRSQAVERAHDSLRNLRKLTSDNPRQQTRITDIEELLEQRLAWEDKTIAFRREQGLAPAASLVSQGTGMALGASLLHRLAEMQAEEYRLLGQDDRQSKETAATTFLLLPIGVFLSLTILLGALFFLNTGIGERITAESNLLASLKDVQDLKDALDEHAIVAITDPRGDITFVNDKFCAISQYRREELLGQNHRIINSGHHSPEFFRDLWSTISQGRVWKNEIQNRAKDGSFYWVDTTIVPFLDARGKPRQYVAIRNDITERKRAEAEILELNATLEKRVTQRTAELQAANKELDTFCYSVSHDLRAPLRGIAGFSRILADTYGGKLDATAQDYLRRVIGATERMGELIDDLLKLSRVSREDLHPQTVDLAEMAETVMQSLRQAAPGRAVEFVKHDTRLVLGDPRLLRVLLENLLGNAWKFTSKTDRARIVFGAEGEENGQPIHVVRDNGAGFNMAYAGKLFSPFQRLHGQGEFPGTGIGLATVQRIIHRHGGRIWAEAQPGQGAAFFFVLPPALTRHEK